MGGTIEAPKLQGESLHLSRDVLSDLFFNHEHPNYDNLYEGPVNVPSHDEQFAAILLDAKEFCTILNIVQAEALAHDFLKRV